MSQLFDSKEINGMRIVNRFIRSATWEGLAAEDGSVTPRLTDMSLALVHGGIGLIITGHTYVSREGQATPWQLGLYSDELIPGLAGMVEAIHGAGGKIAIQLAHAGVRAASSLSDLEPIGPSPLAGGSETVGRAMDHRDIDETVEAFARAAVRARTAGFDAVQIHGAHGYLLSQFLSPAFNMRTDEYGGSIENRERFVLKIVEATRKAVGTDFPLLIKINSQDFVPGGFSVEDMLHTSAALQEAGIDAIEMSGGTFDSGNKNPSRRGKPRKNEPEAYYEETARRYKEQIRTPLILVGGIRTFETAERLIIERTTDYIALSRPLICEPGLINRWKSGDIKPARCISDNGCFQPGFEGKGISCTVKGLSRQVPVQT
ncbi:MAG: NADH oxidase [Syntrophorhabdus sp. PtaU1.Bin050]|nr:MAG: NADH oxidase [Syntrophorhabdus sp. PtaU1.Bin050]